MGYNPKNEGCGFPWYQVIIALVSRMPCLSLRSTFRSMLVKGVVLTRVAWRGLLGALAIYYCLGLTIGFDSKGGCFNVIGINLAPEKCLLFLNPEILYVDDNYYTLPETNIFAAEKRAGPKRKLSYSNHPFSGAIC